MPLGPPVYSYIKFMLLIYSLYILNKFINNYIINIVIVDNARYSIDDTVLYIYILMYVCSTNFTKKDIKNLNVPKWKTQNVRHVDGWFFLEL